MQAKKSRQCPKTMRIAYERYVVIAAHNVMGLSFGCDCFGIVLLREDVSVVSSEFERFSFSSRLSVFSDGFLKNDAGLDIDNRISYR